ncbi:Protein NRT1/ PTR FAMILY 1.1, partial [Mucuna pruriens]
MAQQENSSEINTSPALKKSFLQSTIASLRNLFIFSMTVPFVGGLVVSYTYVEMAVLSTLMDYLINLGGTNDLRMAAVATNMQDCLASILYVIVSLITAAYTGSFTMITFCAAASIQSLMLMWMSTSTSIVVIYVAIFFLSLGESGRKLSENFFEFQLEEKIKKGKEQGDVLKMSSGVRLYAPTIAALIMMLYISFISDYSKYEENFRFAALFMGGTHLFFLFGYVWYSKEGLTDKSNLRKIYKICKAAFGKRNSKYPTSKDGYHWKDDKKKEHLYWQDSEPRLLPRAPWPFRWLDKAAIVNGKESSDPDVSPETQEMKGQLYSVKEVREVKSLVPMMYLCLAFIPYGLLMACQNTFFVAQASTLEQVISSSGNDIVILSLIVHCVAEISGLICFIISLVFRRRKFKAIYGMLKRKAGIIKIGFGMVCAAICSFRGWTVEAHRLSLPLVWNLEKHKLVHPGTTVSLVPQFILLGMTKGLVEGGLESLFEVGYPKWSFVDSFSQLVIVIGKLLVIPFVFSSWIKETMDASRLDNFYLMLGILNIVSVFLLAVAYYYIRYACFPADENDTVESPSPEDNETQSADQGNRLYYHS